MNETGRETCLRCSANLMVFSGGEGFAEESDEELERQSLAFDEHILERLSDSEEIVRRVEETLGALSERVAELERGLALVEAGVKAVVDLLDRRHVLRETEVLAAWERAASTELEREELLARVRDRREMIISRARLLGRAAGTACERALKSAELAVLAGHVSRAVEILAGALRRFPENTELASLLGELAFEREDLESAESYFRHVVELEPTAVDARIFLGSILADTGREDEACSELERAAKLAPASFLPHFALGALHASAGRHDEARRHLAETLQREPYPQALVLLGLVELEAGRPGAAVTALEAAIEAVPDFDEAIYYLGLAYLERGWRRKALDSFRRVLELDPQRLQFQEAVRLVEGLGAGAAPLDPEAEAVMREAWESVEDGDVDGALHALDAARAGSDHPTLVASAALLAAAAGRHRQAIAAAHRLLRSGARGSAELAAWTVVLETLRATRRFDLAARWGRRLHEQNSNPLQRGLAAFELALIELERGGDDGRALEYAHQALELLPRELRQHPLVVLGRIHLVREEYSDAVLYLEQAATIAPSPVVLTQLGLALLGQGERDRAREVLQRARTGSGRDLKTDVLTHVARAGFLATHGRRKG